MTSRTNCLSILEDFVKQDGRQSLIVNEKYELLNVDHYTRRTEDGRLESLHFGRSWLKEIHVTDTDITFRRINTTPQPNTGPDYYTDSVNSLEIVEN